MHLLCSNLVVYNITTKSLLKSVVQFVSFIDLSIFLLVLFTLNIFPSEAMRLALIHQYVEKNVIDLDVFCCDGC